MIESQTMLHLIGGIVIILMAASPIFIFIYLIIKAEKDRDTYISNYLEKHKCKKCGNKKSATVRMIEFTSFEMYCENEDCQNYGRHTRHSIEHEQGGFFG